MNKFIDMLETAPQVNKKLADSQAKIAQRIRIQKEREAQIKAMTMQESEDFDQYLSSIDSVIYENAAVHPEGGAVRDGGRFVLSHHVIKTDPYLFGMDTDEHKRFISKAGTKGDAKVTMHAPGFYDLYFDDGDIVPAISGHFVKPA